MQIAEFIDEKLEKIQSKTIFSLFIIILVGFFIRVYFTPWHLPTDSFDSFIFMIEGLKYSVGDFTSLSHRFLWPVVLSLFFGVFRFENYFDYMTIVRVASITISVVTIPVVYLISKEFVKRKYALIAAALFSVEPNLIENSIFGQTEPLFILFGLISFYFILQKNYRYQLLAFVFAGLSFDVRLNGIVLFLLVIFALLLKIKHKESNSKNLVFGIMLFLLVTGPTHIIYPVLQGDEIFPFIGTVTITVSEEMTYYSTYENSSNISSTDIIFNALKNEFSHIFRISIPCLIMLFPIGVIISLKNFDFQKKMLFSAIIFSLIIAIPQYTVSNEFRNLFFLIPFFCIFSAIGIEKLTEKIEMKNLFLVLLIGGLILLSVNFLRERYTIDEEYFLEKDGFGKYFSKNFEGKFTGNMRLELIRNMDDLKIGSNFASGKLVVFDPGITMNSMPQLMEYARENDIEYFVIEDQKFQKHFPIFDEILTDHYQYEFLEEVFDTNSLEYKKLKVTIFKINWEKYNEQQ